MSNTSSVTACVKLIFTKFARSVKNAPVRRTGTYRHEKALAELVATLPDEYQQNGFYYYCDLHRPRIHRLV